MGIYSSDCPISMQYMLTCILKVCCVLNFETPPWAVAHQAPLSMEFSRQEYCSELPFPTPGDLPDPGIEPVSLASRALAGGLFIIGTS